MRARYDELERKLRFVGGEIGAFGLSIMRQASRALARWHCNSLPVQVRGMRSGSGVRSKVGYYVTTALWMIWIRSSTTLLSALEAELEKHESQLVELRVCSRELTAKYNAKVEHQECLIRAEAFFKAGALFEPSDPILNIVEPPEDGLQPLLVNDISGAYSSAAYAD